MFRENANDQTKMHTLNISTSNTHDVFVLKRYHGDKPNIGNYPMPTTPSFVRQKEKTLAMPPENMPIYGFLHPIYLDLQHLS